MNEETQPLSETEAALKVLYDKGYLVDIRGMPTLTAAFFAYKNVKEEISGSRVDYALLYKQFIKDARVPFRPKNYTCNQYSLTGQKAFERLVKDPKVDMEKLRKAAEYYYRSTEYPKTIEKFLTDRIWENYYDKFAGKPAAGTSSEPAANFTIEL